nr:MAG TPA: hypothetical protein [Caudoviricetes sp.]
MAEQKKKKGNPGEERFVTSGKSITVLKPANGNTSKKKSGAAKGGK